MAKTPSRPSISFGLLVGAMAMVLGAGMLFLPPRWQDMLLVILVAISALVFLAIVVIAYRVRASGAGPRD